MSLVEKISKIRKNLIITDNGSILRPGQRNETVYTMPKIQFTTITTQKILLHQDEQVSMVQANSYFILN